MQEVNGTRPRGGAGHCAPVVCEIQTQQGVLPEVDLSPVDDYTPGENDLSRQEHTSSQWSQAERLLNGFSWRPPPLYRAWSTPTVPWGDRGLATIQQWVVLQLRSPDQYWEYKVGCPYSIAKARGQKSK